jgi:hypothetical protein
MPPPLPRSGPLARRGRLLVWLEAPLRRPSYAIAPAVVAVLAALGSSLLIPERYRAATLVRAQWEADEGVPLSRVGVDVAARRLQDVRRRVLDRELLEELLRELGPASAAVPPGEVEAAHGALSVEQRRPGVYAIEYVHREPLSAALGSRRVAALVVRQAEAERSLRPDLRALEARLLGERKAFEELQAAVARLRESMAGVPPPEPDGGASQRERSVEQRTGPASEPATARAQAESLPQAISGAAPPAPSDTGPSAELVRLRADLTALRQRYTEEHPDVASLRVRIRSLEGELAAAAVRAPGSSEDAPRSQLDRPPEEVEALRDRARRPAAAADRLARPDHREGQRAVVVDPLRELERLDRDYASARERYHSALEEWREAETAARLNSDAAVRFEIEEPARVPDRSFFPDRSVFSVVGLALGLALGLAVALIAELRDRSVKGSQDLQELLPYPLLAELPLVRLPRAERRS